MKYNTKPKLKERELRSECCGDHFTVTVSFDSVNGEQLISAIMNKTKSTLKKWIRHVICAGCNKECNPIELKEEEKKR